MTELKKAPSKLRSFVSTFGELARTTSAVLSILVVFGFGATIVGYFKQALILFAGGATLLVSSMLVLALVSITAFKIAQRRGPLSYPVVGQSVTESKFELLLKEIVYQYQSDGQTMCQRKRFRLRSLVDDMVSFSDRYSWTGGGKCTIKSVTQGFTISNQRDEEFWKTFDVMFPKTLKKGEIVEFTVQWDLFDDSNNAVPFLSTMIDAPTERLIMQVVLPSAMASEKAFFHEFSNYIDKLPISTEELTWNPASLSFTHQIDQPVMNRKYLIRWHPNGPAAAPAST